MTDSLYIAWCYLRHHKLKTGMLLAAITLVVYLPAGINVLVDESAEQLRARAVSTPLIIGARGSHLELVLNSLYFESTPPARTTMAELDRVRQSELAAAIPLYSRFRAHGHPIVGTSSDYFDYRGISIRDGRQFKVLGECVVGSVVAAKQEIVIGDFMLSSPENVFDWAGVYPLKMRVVGVLAPAGTPDDHAVFVDVKTAWIIEGLGHGHEDLRKTVDEENLGAAHAAVATYNEITPDNAASFHFHGDPNQFPITAVIAVPHDEKSKAMLMGRFLAEDDSSQAVLPIEVMDDLLTTVIRIRRFMVAGALLLGLATMLTVILVLMLSLQLRRAEIATMAKLGCSRFRIASVLACEVFVVLALSIGLASGLTAVTSRFSEQAIHWFLL
jgi:putative ABC transport system permease protein